MATVGIGLALSLEGLLQRFPALRDFGIGRLRRNGTPVSPETLASIIEAQVIPRLLVAHLPATDASPSAAESGPPAVPPPTAADVENFAHAVLARDVTDLQSDLDRLLESGVGPQSVLLDLFVPTARMLGTFWDEDRCDFVDVTMGMWRLQELTHALADRLRPTRNGSGTVRRALFGLVEGDQHVLAPLVVSEYFRSCGWDAVNLGGAGDEALVAAVASEPFDLVGLTISQDPQVERVPGLIEALRTNSCNPGLLVMVGGSLLTERPELALLLGADATASDARVAVQRAESLLNAYGFTGARHC
ncbi:MAG: cobalamin-dependent protein [Sphingomonadaceae bacterium]